jgi:hypothetical protein
MAVPLHNSNRKCDISGILYVKMYLYIRNFGKVTILTSNKIIQISFLDFQWNSVTDWKDE